MDRELFEFQSLPTWKRAVLKVGSSLLSGAGGLSPHHAVHLAAFVHACHAQGREVVIVSSGAVAAGRGVLHAKPHPGAAMAERQALAALGQARLMGFWQGLFARPVAQVLLTHDDVRDRRRYLNARATLDELLRCGALLIVNENDTVSVDELKLGDNDTLGAIVAALIDADMLFLATDIDGLYDSDPRSNPHANPMPLVVDPGDDILAMAGGAGSSVGTGGMRTKILAAQRAGAAGIDTVLFNGTRAHVAHALGEDRLIARAAATADGSAAPMEQPQHDAAGLCEELGERRRGAIELPVAGEEAAVLVAVRIAEHDLLVSARGADEIADAGQGMEIAHDRRRAAPRPAGRAGPG